MTQTLSPQQAAAIASGVYKLQHTTLEELAANQQDLGCEGLFQTRRAGYLKGYSGALRWKQLSGFGYVAEGEAGTPFEAHVLVATRGTLGAKTGPDWISNYNIGIQLGPSGLPVHAGFHEIWKTFSRQLLEFLEGRRPRHVHCVGHSLGGALASLNADSLTGRHVAPVSLYTFGAPRVGDGVFARSLTRRLQGDSAPRVYRVFHASDPVPMIPLFPFWHMPFGRAGLQISNSISGLINADAHSMADSYIKGVGANKSWADLEGDAMAYGSEASQVKSWLETAAQGKGSFLMGSAHLLTMISRALVWLMKQAGKLMLHAVGGTLVVGATVLDQLAWGLSQGAALSKELGVHIKALISSIWAFLGRKAMQMAELTVAFLRWVLGLLYSSIRAVAQRAMAFLE